MNGWNTLFVSLVLSVVFSVGASYVLAPVFTTPSSDGSVGQSPILYIVIILATLIIGTILYFSTRSPEGSPFNFWLFVCVAFSGLMIGGIIHEFTHVVLISHPTQFRVHFGDSSSIFSTCCLNPGEYDNELFAYGIQFLVMIGWILAFKDQFLRRAAEKKMEEKKPVHRPKIHQAESQGLISEKEDPEWVAMRKETERLLQKTRRGKEDSFTNELPDLRRLKVPPRV